MALFTVRNRIAIAVLAVIILAGWGVRLFFAHDRGDDVQILRGAVQPPIPAAVSPSAAPDSVSSPSAAPLSPALLVDINRANAGELDKLPLIGPSKAEAIIRYRVEHGPFAKPADIMNVKGIGPGIYSHIEKLITVGNTGGKAPE
jgi:competence ComEA-like helix-hairpin-helix protein